ncbi:MAG: class II aldolase/adducin family protein [Chitinophagaceae bacterium]
MKDEGVIKFKYSWIQERPMPYEWISELNKWRDKLYKAGLVGKDTNGVGYGNISIRLERNNFIITGSGTGSLTKLNAEHYSKVTAYDLTKNMLTSVGPVKASSESLTHAAIYEAVPELNVVFHIHHLALWEKLQTRLPFTAKHIEYGTTAMAGEIARLLKDPQVLQQGIVAMGGHREGVLSFGKNLEDAGRSIDKWLVAP